ncbi:hypothetical protein [Streptomyces halobius]|uniref:Integral membrane protein n=1 Tax=Streptomyces halobius TaxID=2879846 RepID=A0ABY4MIA5_9ACTN|nr:hypothetical protein [Streptomyces halobius]UQA97539.1 hypothetical protein K9S39_41865 [Streptomyces halobius]
MEGDSVAGGSAMTSTTLAVNVTPAGVPVIGAVIALALLAGLVWDALRKPGEPWFRWLLPAGYCLLLAGFAVGPPLIVGAALVMGAGLALTNRWRWTHRNAQARRPSGRNRLRLPRD